jgi:glucarate dehydratase
LKIVDIKATTVAVPLEATLRHSAGAHWGRFVRTIVEVITDEGISGWGELGGGGESSVREIEGLLPYLKGHDPLQLEQLRWKIMNPVACLYNNRMQLHAAIEMACMDVAGKKLGIRACDFLGGSLRESVPFAAYLFYRNECPERGVADEHTADAIVAQARHLKETCGFKTHKLKGGVFSPEHDVEVYSALADAFPGDKFRLDPNSVWSVETAIWVAGQIGHIRNDYFEDPCFGLEGMRRLRDRISIPTATNVVVVNFEQLASCIKTDSVDVILLDTTFWGGLRQAHRAGQVLECFQYGHGVHSSGELGIQLASMLHLGASLPNMTCAADAHYHHLQDDIIVGGKMEYVNGEIAVPKGPGLGVEVDREKLEHYARYFNEMGGYPYDRDPLRPDWYSVQPESNFAKP